MSWEEHRRKMHLYHMALVNIDNDVQDRSLASWKRLCEYVDIVAEEERDEFSPYEKEDNPT
ncbi:MAG: hypothetical protein AAF502_16905 [Bacteroidota bacterium]